MALKVTYSHPGFVNGQEVDLTGVGLVEIGKAKTLSKEDEEAFVTRVGMGVKDYFHDEEMVKVEGTTELKADEVKTLVVEEGGEG